MSLALEDPGAAWYCVYTHAQQEFLVQAYLRQQGFEVFLPHYLRYYVRRPPKSRPLFPAYLFVRFNVEHDYWRNITVTTGVRRLFSSSAECPTAVPPQAIQTMREVAQLEADKQQGTTVGIPSEIPPGCEVLIRRGHLVERSGICIWSETARVRLLMEIMGHSAEVTFRRADVELLQA